MGNDSFVYVTYIATTPEKIWKAIVEGDLTRKYWGHENVSDWKKGSSWQHVSSDDKREVKIVGEVLETVPNKRLVLSWADPTEAADRKRYTRVAMEIEQVGKMVRLTITHDEFAPGSDMGRKIAEGWPRVVSSLKSFLETGHPLDTWAGERVENAGTVLRRFYDAVQARDMVKARSYLDDRMVFVGLFETYPSADAYIATFSQLMQIVRRLETKVIIGEGENAAIFMEMETTAPAAATTLVAEWHQTRNGKIIRAQSAFDGRPFVAMFAGKGRSA